MGILRTARHFFAKQKQLLFLIVATFSLYCALSMYISDSPGGRDKQPMLDVARMHQDAWSAGADSRPGTDTRALQHNKGMVEKVSRMGGHRNSFPRGDDRRVVAKHLPGYRVVHLDLKGAPPRLDFLIALVPLLKKAGANALLIEYEDMFPFEGVLANLSALNAYDRRELTHFLKEARNSGFEIIPLVQTFGHLEFALKLPEFRSLREMDAFPQEVCPSKTGSFDLIKEMLRQVMQMHPNSKWVHVGCDEVFHLAACSDCNDRLKMINSELRQIGDPADKDGRHLFLLHVKRIAEHVRDEYKSTPIIWDDMLRNIASQDLVNSQLGTLVEPMVWSYTDNVDRLIPPYVWRKYGEVFPHVWGASSFKGAFGETLHIPDVRKHLENTVSWLEVMAREVPRVNFRGLVLTGWSRYDHFAVLCELLPPSIPSLVANLLAATAGGNLKVTFERLAELMGCPASTVAAQKLGASLHLWELTACDFPGKDFFAILNAYEGLVSDVKIFSQVLTEKKGWMTSYNIRHKFSSPWRVVEDMRKYTMAKSNVETLRENARNALRQYFDHYTVNEWLEQKVQPLTLQLNQLEEASKILLAPHTWPRRPIL